MGSLARHSRGSAGVQKADLGAKGGEMKDGEGVSQVVEIRLAVYLSECVSGPLGFKNANLGQIVTSWRVN